MAAAPDRQRLPDAPPVAGRDLPVGGQAVIEGVMMRGVCSWAVAVRAPAPEQIAGGRRMQLGEATRGEVQIRRMPLDSVLKRHRWMRVPVVRGVIALGESLRIGFLALNISVNTHTPDDEAPVSGGKWFGTVAFALALAVGLFFLLPVALTSLVKDSLPNSLVFVLVEKVLRISIFLAYIWAVSRMKDLRRVFEYHGAEHKTIHCYEAGLELTPENAQRFSRLHPRCGTSFMLIVMVVAIVVFAPLGTPAWYWLFASRIVGIPLIAGLAFEIIKWFGRNRSKRWARVLMAPGMKLQLLTTREPDLAQLAVAVAALEAVLEIDAPAVVTEGERIGMEVVA
ncbi:MAG: DUF1385 domain-containing protein [Solirubrobacteraceae bacterium]